MSSAIVDSDSVAAGDGFHVRHLTVAFDGTDVVDDVLIDAARGEVTGIAGESGSGKTTAVLAAIGYRPAGASRVAGLSLLSGVAVLGTEFGQVRRLWGKRISYVPQDAGASLNPVRRVGSLLTETLTVNLGLHRRQARAQALELLRAVQIPDPVAASRRYAHEFSGGQVQRIAIALAIATNPELLVLDEPTTGLDVTTQAEVIGLLQQLIRQRSIAAIYISHDLGLLAAIAQKIIVLYAGEVVEQGLTSDVLTSPRHPYTRALLNAIPTISESRLPVPIPGLPPGRVIHAACAFAARCSWRIDACNASHPRLQVILPDDRLVRCVRQPELGPFAASRAGVRPSAAPSASVAPLVELETLTCTYGSGHGRIVAVQGVSFQVRPREVLAVVGESGSGKSTIARAILGLVKPTGGRVLWRGEQLARSAEARRKDQRRAIQMIFQNPDSSLNPRHTVFSLIERSILLFGGRMSSQDRATLVREALTDVQLDPAIAGRFPHQLSGGQKQRVAIARALAARPEFLICDEIVSGQDVSVQAALLVLLERLQDERRMSILFISHDLAVVRSLADRVVVMQHGSVVEAGTLSEVFGSPSHEYTRTLLHAAAS